IQVNPNVLVSIAVVFSVRRAQRVGNDFQDTVFWEVFFSGQLIDRGHKLCLHKTNDNEEFLYWQRGKLTFGSSFYQYFVDPVYQFLLVRANESTTSITEPMAKPLERRNLISFSRFFFWSVSRSLFHFRSATSVKTCFSSYSSKAFSRLRLETPFLLNSCSN